MIELISMILKTGGELSYDKEQGFFLLDSEEGLFKKNGVNYPLYGKDLEILVKTYVEKFNNKQ